MILPFDHDSRLKAACPAYGRECAGVLFLRGMIAENHKEQVAEVAAQWIGAAELAAAELAQRNLIARQNRAAAAEFMKRVARRILLNTASLSDGEARRSRSGARARAYRVLKRNSLLTADRLTTLVTRLVAGGDMPAS